MARCLIALVLLLGATGGALAEPLPRVAVFPMKLVDGSLGGEVGGTEPSEQARIDLLSDELRSRVRASGRVDVVLPEEVAATCTACELEAARQVGADYALTGRVHKMSELILNINLMVRNVRSGDVVFQDNVDIRSNSDRSWLRGLRHLVDRRLLAPPR